MSTVYVLADGDTITREQLLAAFPEVKVLDADKNVQDAQELWIEHWVGDMVKRTSIMFARDEVSAITEFGSHDVQRISEKLGVRFISEHDDEFEEASEHLPRLVPKE